MSKSCTSRGWGRRDVLHIDMHVEHTKKASPGLFSTPRGQDFRPTPGQDFAVEITVKLNAWPGRDYSGSAWRARGSLFPVRQFAVLLAASRSLAWLCIGEPVSGGRKPSLPMKVLFWGGGSFTISSYSITRIFCGKLPGRDHLYPNCGFGSYFRMLQLGFSVE